MKKEIIDYLITYAKIHSRNEDKKKDIANAPPSFQCTRLLSSQFLPTAREGKAFTSVWADPPSQTPCRQTL